MPNLISGSECKQQQGILKTEGVLEASLQFNSGHRLHYLRLHSITWNIQNSSKVLTFLLGPKALPLHAECSPWLACETGVICLTFYPLNPACWVDSSFQGCFLLLEGEFLEELCLYSFSFGYVLSAILTLLKSGKGFALLNQLQSFQEAMAEKHRFKVC